MPGRTAHLNRKHCGLGLMVSWMLNPEKWQMPQHLRANPFGWWHTATYSCIKNSSAQFLKWKQLENSRQGLLLFLWKRSPSRHWVHKNMSLPGTVSDYNILFILPLKYLLLACSALRLHSHSPHPGPHPQSSRLLNLFPTGCSVPRLLLPHLLCPPYAQGAKGMENIQNLPIWSK